MENTEQGGRKLRKCLRCKHEWFTRLEVVKRCAGCKSPYWDVARGAGVVIQHKEAAERLLSDVRVKAVKEAVSAPQFAVDPEPYMTPTGTVKRSDEVERRSFLKVAAAPKAKWKKGAK